MMMRKKESLQSYKTAIANSNPDDKSNNIESPNISARGRVNL
jgi:hypothetical protein